MSSASVSGSSADDKSSCVSPITSFGGVSRVFPISDGFYVRIVGVRKHKNKGVVLYDGIAVNKDNVISILLLVSMTKSKGDVQKGDVVSVKVGYRIQIDSEKSEDRSPENRITTNSRLREEYEVHDYEIVETFGELFKCGKRDAMWSPMHAIVPGPMTCSSKKVVAILQVLSKKAEKVVEFLESPANLATPYEDLLLESKTPLESKNSSSIQNELTSSTQNGPSLSKRKTCMATLLLPTYYLLGPGPTWGPRPRAGVRADDIT